MERLNRRQLLTTGLATGAAGIVASSASAALHPTPPEIEGPFYPVYAQKDKDFDLTRVEGREGVAKGDIIIIEGRVLDTNGKPIEDATVDLWQANAAGRYRHPHDPNKAPLDENFQGWAIVPSGADGGFRFKSVFPGVYPAGRGWFRPPHIHFKVSKRGYIELVTQMYFPEQELNDKDLLLRRKSEDERARMIAKLVDEESDGDDSDADEESEEMIPRYQYEIVLEMA